MYSHNHLAQDYTGKGVLKYGQYPGILTRKMYIPAKMAPRNPYPHWHKIWEILPLPAQNVLPDPYPYWHKSTKKGTLGGITIVEKWLIGTIVGPQRQQFG